MIDAIAIGGVLRIGDNNPRKQERLTHMNTYKLFFWVSALHIYAFAFVVGVVHRLVEFC